MKSKYLACAAITCAMFLPGLSQAKGCLKGAAVGGVGGHVAGHHGILGAAAGCAIGRHMANKKQAAPVQTGPATASSALPAPAATKP